MAGFPKDPTLYDAGPHAVVPAIHCTDGHIPTSFGSTQGRTPASPAEIVHFLEIWQSLVQSCALANRRFRRGISLGTPKLNAYVTESLAVHLINSQLLADVLPDVIAAALARGAGPEPDIFVRTRSGKLLRLEVKSTGPTTWQRASSNDASADYFIWLNLAPLLNEVSVAHIWVLPEPGRFLRAGLDWRSERQFARLTNQRAICIPLPLSALLEAADAPEHLL